MARIREPTAAELAEYQAWVASRPPSVRVVAERFDPWSLYRLRSTRQRVVIRGFSEGDDAQPVTVSVFVTGQFNVVLFDRTVFGINPEDLELCDLPAADEFVGTVLTPADVEDNRDMLRLLVRPDLWVRDEATGMRKH